MANSATGAPSAAAAPPEARASARYVRVAPNKARQVISHIRGMRVEQARQYLLLSPKGIAEQILKTLDSAVANAEHNKGLDADDLVVAAAFVDEGPTLKRYQPRAMGRAYRVRKRTSHITIGVGAQQRPAAGPADGRGRRVKGRRRRGAADEGTTAQPATTDAESTEQE